MGLAPCSGDNVEVADDGAAAEVEEVRARSTVASAPALPVADVGERVIDLHSLSQLGASLGSEPPLSKLREQLLVGMDRDRAALRARGASLLSGQTWQSFSGK